MRVMIDELPVFFPYELLYKEQLEYMTQIKRALDNNTHAILEMPTGTGKTVCLLSIFTSYMAYHPDRYNKLIYCTRTVAEMEKTLQELKGLVDKKEDRSLLAVGLSARRNLCVHSDVSQYKEKEKVDSECKKLTAPWVRDKHQGIPGEEDYLCEMYENYQATRSADTLRGVYSLEDMKQVFGRQNRVCPYYLARDLVDKADVVVYNYLYLLDPSLSDLIRHQNKDKTIVVFDEAHNIDDICIDAFTIRLNKGILQMAGQSIEQLQNDVGQMAAVDQHKLKQEYTRLLEGLSARGVIDNQQKQALNNNPAPALAKQAIPGNIRKADHFLKCVRKVLIFLKGLLNKKDFRSFSTQTFLDELGAAAHVDRQALSCFSDRFSHMLRYLQITATDQLVALQKVLRLGSLVGGPTSNSHFALVMEPNPNDGNIHDPQLTLACLESSLAMKPIFSTYKSVLLTSGTMSPLDMYPRLLDFQPGVVQSIPIHLARNNISPLVVTKGSDQIQVSSEYSERQNKSVIRNYANLLLELCQTVPDGIVCFFPSYRYMEDIIFQWNEMEVLEKVLEYKVLYIESRDVTETSLSLAHYRKACDIGRGAVFLSVARGKVAEGIDFNAHYGRCVVMFGMPFQYTKCRILNERMEYLKREKGVRKEDFLIFDAMRQCAQCLGRVVRNKQDYGLMVLADKRYSRSDKKDKLPEWIKQAFDPAYLNLTVDMANYIAREYYKQMAQPYQLPSSLYYTQADLQ